MEQRPSTTWPRGSTAVHWTPVHLWQRNRKQMHLMLWSKPTLFPFRYPHFQMWGRNGRVFTTTLRLHLQETWPRFSSHTAAELVCLLTPGPSHCVSIQCSTTTLRPRLTWTSVLESFVWTSLLLLSFKWSLTSSWASAFNPLKDWLKISSFFTAKEGEKTGSLKWPWWVRVINKKFNLN